LAITNPHCSAVSLR